MPFFTDIRNNSYNNVIQVNGKLFIEGQEYQLENLAPVPLKRGPTMWPPGTAYNATVTLGVQGCSQLCLPKTYVRGSMGLLPQQTQAGEFDTEKIMCGQDCQVGFVWSSGQQRYYGVAGSNTVGDVSAFDTDFRVISPGIATLGTVSAYTAGASYSYPGIIFLPSQNARWITLQTQSQFIATTSGQGAINRPAVSVGSFTEAGIYTSRGSHFRYPSIPYYDSQWMFLVAVGWYLAQANDTYSGVGVYAYNRNTGVETVVNGSWLSQANIAAASMTLCYPTNAVVETTSAGAATQVYFYQPVMSATDLRVFIGTISNLASTPTINAYNASGAQLTLDTSQWSFPNVPTTTFRRVRGWVFEDAGDKYLCLYVYEPGTTNTVPTNTMNLYLYALPSKGVATFMQKVELGLAGRVRSILTLDQNRKRVAVVYDTGIIYYAWNSGSWWVYQSRQDVNTQEVGVDQEGRVWATDTIGTWAPNIPTGGTNQGLYVFEQSGAAVSMNVEFEESSYLFTGSSIASRIVINAYDTTGNRIVVDVTLTRNTENFEFSGGSSSTTVTTSATGNTFVDILVISTGLLSCRAATS